MPNDQDFEVLPPVIPSIEELAIRRTAVALVGEHWHELSGRLAHWLGQAYREDDSLPAEVALRMMRRYANGHGRLAAHLRANADSSPLERKQILFGEAKFVFREVLPRVVEHRKQCQRLIELGDDHVGSGYFGDPEQTEILPTDRLLGNVELLLAVGARAWDALCLARLVDPTSWTEDQKWTAIAMMWRFSVDEIAEIRCLKAQAPGTPVASRAATRQLMRTVRRKGKVLLDSLPRDQLRDYDVLGRAS